VRIAIARVSRIGSCAELHDKYRKPVLLAPAAMGTFPSQLDFVPLVQALLGHAKQNTPPLPVESTQVQDIPPRSLLKEKKIYRWGISQEKSSIYSFIKCEVEE
jgi:hypothetical protein